MQRPPEILAISDNKPKDEDWTTKLTIIQSPCHPRESLYGAQIEKSLNRLRPSESELASERKSLLPINIQ